MPDPAITVFTPTFNRAHTLDVPFRSLARQTFRDFEWIVIDDGSTDGTREKIDGFRGAADFPVRYEWQPNRGQARRPQPRGRARARPSLRRPGLGRRALARTMLHARRTAAGTRRRLTSPLARLVFTVALPAGWWLHRADRRGTD